MFTSRLKALQPLAPALRGAGGARGPACARRAPEFGRARAFSTTAAAERHILVGVDGGDASMQAVDTAVQMAAEEDEVTLFSVPPVLEADPARAGAQLADAVAQAYASARDRVKSTAYEAIEGAKVREALPAGAGSAENPCLPFVRSLAPPAPVPSAMCAGWRAMRCAARARSSCAASTRRTWTSSCSAPAISPSWRSKLAAAPPRSQYRPHSPLAPPRIFMGSVSNYVAARANCTVLVVR